MQFRDNRFGGAGICSQIDDCAGASVDAAPPESPGVCALGKREALAQQGLEMRDLSSSISGSSPTNTGTDPQASFNVKRSS